MAHLVFLLTGIFFDLTGGNAMAAIIRRVLLFAGLFSSIPLLFFVQNAWSLLAPAVLLAGITGYFAIPWPHKEVTAISHGRVRAVILPDLIGFAMCGLLCFLGAMAVSEGAPPPVLIFMSLFGMLFLSLNAIAAWYENLQLVISPEGIIMRTIRGRQYLRFEEMAEAGPIRYSMPEWMKWFGAVAALLSFRATIPLLVQKGRRDPGFRIIMKNGKRYTIWGTALQGFEKVERSVAVTGVPGLSSNPAKNKKGPSF